MHLSHIINAGTQIHYFHQVSKFSVDASHMLMCFLFFIYKRLIKEIKHERIKTNKTLSWLPFSTNYIICWQMRVHCSFPG